MGINPVGLSAQQPVRLSAEALTAVPEFPVAAVARVLSALGVQGTNPEQVRDTAVGLGLFRYPAAGIAGETTLQNVGRILLAGYGLPASIDQATWPELRRRLGRGMQVFVLLHAERNGAVPATPVVLRVCRYSKKFRKVFTLPTRDEASTLEPTAEPLDEFLSAWGKAGNLTIAAVRRWEDLPAEGGAFFGGHRTPEGTYHWHTAECETDAHGGIVSF